jgi:multicomponent K+:H+ antiporter subunit G
MNLFSETLVSILLLAGSVFVFIASLGLYRFRDFYTRLHAPTLASTLGVACLLVASAVFFSLKNDHISMHEWLVLLLLFITTPISTHLLAKVALRRQLASIATVPEEPATSTQIPSRDASP